MGQRYGSLRVPILAHREVVVLKELSSRTVFIVVKLVEQDDIGVHPLQDLSNILGLSGG